MLEIEDIRQLELETSPRHSKTMRVGDRNWYVDVGLLNIHKVGGWEPDDQEHLSVIIWQARFFVFWDLFVFSGRKNFGIAPNTGA